MTNTQLKGLLGTASAFMVVAMLMGSTLAWSDFTQTSAIKLRGISESNVTLHNDFDGENKDVYVENLGDTPLYIRVRLDEYMQIGSFNALGQNITDTENAALVTSADYKNWTPHTYQESDWVEGDADTTLANYSDSGGVIADGCFAFRSYYRWMMSGSQIHYKTGTAGMVSSDLDGIDSDGEALVDPYSATDNKITQMSHIPMTMAAWLALSPEQQAAINDPSGDGSNQGGCWLLDTDGWCYWSAPLAGGNATNLLLDKVTRILKPEKDWYYGIDIKMQAVSRSDLGQWTKGEAENDALYSASENAKALIASFVSEGTDTSEIEQTE